MPIPSSQLLPLLRSKTLLTSLRHPQHCGQHLNMPVGKTVLHPSQPVHITGEMPPLTSIPKPKGRSQVLSRTAPAALPSCLLRTLLAPMSSPPSKALALVRPPTPPRGFTDVTSCLKAPEFMEISSNMPVGPMSIGLVATPGISSVSLERVMKDDTMGLVYMDTVTTSVGRVILGEDSVDSPGRPVIEDITDQI